MMKNTLPYAWLLNVLLTAAVVLWSAQGTEACTRVLWNNNKLMVVSGRTMDWPESTQPAIVVFPRGLNRNGGLLGSEQLIKENPKTWTSKYGSLVVSVYGLGSADGFNEAGLGVHMLYFTETDFGPRDVERPGLQAGLWGPGQSLESHIKPLMELKR